jgi:hypothetical protein
MVLAAAVSVLMATLWGGRATVTADYDGYYAMPYFRESGGDSMFNVVDYKGSKGRPAPDIIRHEYRWDEVK